MVDSMMVPIKFTGVMNGCLSGSYIGGNSGTLSPIYIENSTQFTVTGCNLEAYGANFTVLPPPRVVNVVGGSQHSYIGNQWKLSGNSTAFNGIAPLTSCVGSNGVQDFIALSPNQFSNDSTIATTSYVTGRGNTFSGELVYTTSSTLLDTASGKFIITNSASAITITLPSVFARDSYSMPIFIFNYGSGTLTINAVSGQSIRTVDPTLGNNSFIELINAQGAASWYVSNRGNS
jgi:hypothetical protein